MSELKLKLLLLTATIAVLLVYTYIASDSLLTFALLWLGITAGAAFVAWRALIGKPIFRGAA